jgi:hypothetical protein
LRHACSVKLAMRPFLSRTAADWQGRSGTLF